MCAAVVAAFILPFCAVRLEAHADACRHAMTGLRDPTACENTVSMACLQSQS